MIIIIIIIYGVVFKTDITRSDHRWWCVLGVMKGKGMKSMPLQTAITQAFASQRDVEGDSFNPFAEQERQKLQRENKKLRDLLNIVKDDLAFFEANIKLLEEERVTLLLRIDELQTRLRNFEAEWILV